MKTRITFLALLLLFVLPALAQQEEPVNSKKGTIQNQETSYAPPVEAVPRNDLAAGGGGNPAYFYYGDPSGMYLDEEWMPGRVSVKAGEEMEALLRYNIYQQKVEAIMDVDTFAFAKPGELEWVMIGDKKFIFSNYLRNDLEVASTWFEVLCEGECDLLLRHYIKYRIDDGDDDPANDQMYRLESFYTRKNNASGERLSPTRKDIPLVLLDHQEELSGYIKEHKLNLKDQDDLVKLFTYYNSLD